MQLETLIVARTDDTIHLTINRPDKLNALSPQVLCDLEQLLTRLTGDADGARGMILTGAGERAFAAGADIEAMSRMSPDEGAAFARLGQRVTELIEALPFPVIACVDGHALGGGCELAMACDYVFATDRAVFGQPEVKLGLIPGFGGCVRLLRLVGPGRAREIIYTGRDVLAGEALTIGLVNRVYPSRREMLAGAEESLALIARRSPVAVAACKQVLCALDGTTMPQALAIERAGFRRAFASGDKVEGVGAFLARRAPAFHGAPRM